MEHLIRETLARLVDELPTAAEREHLEACDACAAELETLRHQSDVLGRLPDLRPSPGDFDALEARLAAEGLIQVGSRTGYPELAVTPRWMRRAAAIALFAAGAGTGGLVTARLLPAGGSELAAAAAADPDDALAHVEAAERDYVAALVQYRQMVGASAPEEMLGEPAARYQALEHLVRAGQAAVRQAPADPFLNGLLASALAEQQVVSRRISTDRASQDGWY